MRAGQTRHDNRPDPPPARCLADLTPRQQQIARLIAAGYSIIEIPGLLGSTHNTVRNQMTGIYARCGLNDGHGCPRMRLALWVWRQIGVPERAA